MRVLLIHQIFTSPNQAGGTRHYELAQQAVVQGHSFTIVSSDINHLTGQPVVNRRGLMVEENIDGMRVLHAYTLSTPHSNFFWKIVYFASFMFTAFLAALRAGPVDVVMGTSPPIFQAVTAWFAAKMRRKPFVLEIRDLWPDFPIGSGKLTNPILIRLSYWLEMFLYRNADAFIVNSPAYRDHLIEKGLEGEKIHVVPNGVDPAMFDPVARGEQLREALGLQNKFIVTYAGNIGIPNDIGTILDAAEQLQERSDIHFLIVGDGPLRQELAIQANRRGLPNLTFTGSFPKSEMRTVLAASDACIATLKNIPMYRKPYPNKVFDYMAAGRPTILAIDGVIRDVIEKSEGGIFVTPGNSAELAEAVCQLGNDREYAQRLGLSARNYVATHFDRALQAEQFIKVLEQVASIQSDSR